MKLEDRFDPALVAALKEAGHDVEILSAYRDADGHAGAVVLHENGLMEAATDPRADGLRWWIDTVQASWRVLRRPSMTFLLAFWRPINDVFRGGY